MSHFRPSFRLWPLLAAALFLTLPPPALAVAASSQNDPQQEQEEVQSYTDEDLHRMRHRPAPKPAPDGAEAEPGKASQPQTGPSRPGPFKQEPKATPAASKASPPPAGQATPPPPPGKDSAGKAAGKTKKRYDPWAKKEPVWPPGADLSEEEWLAQRLDNERRREHWEGRVQVAEEQVRELEERMTYLERKLASAQNPFLPRVELEPEDAKAEAGLDGVQRLARSETQLAEARSALEAARRAVELERRQAQEALRTAGIPTN